MTPCLRAWFHSASPARPGLKQVFFTKSWTTFSNPPCYSGVVSCFVIDHWSSHITQPLVNLRFSSSSGQYTAARSVITETIARSSTGAHENRPGIAWRREFWFDSRHERSIPGSAIMRSYNIYKNPLIRPNIDIPTQLGQNTLGFGSVLHHKQNRRYRRSRVTAVGSRTQRLRCGDFVPRNWLAYQS